MRWHSPPERLVTFEWTAKNGTHKIRAYVDSTDTLIESDEVNNWLDKEITVKEKVIDNKKPNRTDERPKLWIFLLGAVIAIVAALVIVMMLLKREGDPEPEQMQPSQGLTTTEGQGQVDEGDHVQLQEEEYEGPG